MNLKKIIISLCAVSTILCGMFTSSMYAKNSIMLEYDNEVHEYSGSLFKLKVNGSAVKTPLEPIIFNDRALVPIREVFEAMGAEVGYDEGNISVKMNGIKVGMSINDPIAEINGEKKTIPDGIVPKLIAKQGESAKTMVPVRFISESIGMDVDFDGKNGVINVNKPSSTLTSVSYSVSGDNYIEVKAKINGGVSVVKNFTLDNPNRIVVDCENTMLDMKKHTIDVNAAGVTSIRTGETNGVTRIVLDVNAIKSYNVTKLDDGIMICATTGGAPSSVSESTTAPTPTPTAKPVEKPTIPQNIQPAQQGELVVVIDSGHGGNDGGAGGKLEGQTINEKDLTLAIAKKVEKIISDTGYRVVMTRTGDTYPTLTERSSLANSLNAAMFVSIHINSADSKEAHGTEVFYSEMNNGTAYGVKSETLAENILDNIIDKVNSRDRGVKSANHVVTRTSNMPAALVEVGFISNEDELRKMCSEEYQQLVAEGIAEGMLKTLKNITVPNSEVPSV